MAGVQIISPYKIICILWLSFSVFIAYSEKAHSQPKFATKYKHFNISGTSIEDIWRSIYQSGPKSNLGVGHAGYTRFKFDNSVSIIPKNGKCVISSIKFRLTSTVQLPKWTSRHLASQEIKIYWEALASDIERHENDHVKIAETSISKLYETLNNIPAQKNCATLKKKVQNEIVKSEKARNRAQNSFERKEIRAQKKRLLRLIEEVRRKYN